MELRKNENIADIFHENSKNHLSIGESIELPEKVVKTVYFKSYPRMESISLSDGYPSKDIDCLDKCLQNRTSTRSFSGKPITLEELSYVLSKSAGMNRFEGDYDASRRSYPSPGARYPTEIYPVVLNGEGIDEGIYHYNVKDSSLEVLETGKFSEDVDELLLMSNLDVENASLFLIITTVLERVVAKYGSRGYRYALMEAGHLGQNIYLTTTAVGLGCCAVGGFHDDSLTSLLGPNNDEEEAIYSFIIGDESRDD